MDPALTWAAPFHTCLAPACPCFVFLSTCSYCSHCPAGPPLPAGCPCMLFPCHVHQLIQGAAHVLSPASIHIAVLWNTDYPNQLGPGPLVQALPAPLPLLCYSPGIACTCSGRPITKNLSHRGIWKCSQSNDREGVCTCLREPGFEVNQRKIGFRLSEHFLCFNSQLQVEFRGWRDGTGVKLLV